MSRRSATSRRTVAVPMWVTFTTRDGSRPVGRSRVQPSSGKIASVTRSRALLAAVVVAVAFGCSSSPPDDDPAAGRALPPVVIPPPAPGAAYLRFIVLGDWGTGGRGQRQVARAMAAWAR